MCSLALENYEPTLISFHGVSGHQRAPLVGWVVMGPACLSSPGAALEAPGQPQPLALGTSLPLQLGWVQAMTWAWGWAHLSAGYSQALMGYGLQHSRSCSSGGGHRTDAKLKCGPHGQRSTSPLSPVTERRRQHTAALALGPGSQPSRKVPNKGLSPNTDLSKLNYLRLASYWTCFMSINW